MSRAVDNSYTRTAIPRTLEGYVFKCSIFEFIWTCLDSDLIAWRPLVNVRAILLLKENFSYNCAVHANLVFCGTESSADLR